MKKKNSNAFEIDQNVEKNIISSFFFTRSHHRNRSEGDKNIFAKKKFAFKFEQLNLFDFRSFLSSQLLQLIFALCELAALATMTSASL